MRSRALNKRIEIRGTEKISDGFGGYTVNDILISNSWAKINSVQAGKSNNLSDFGLIDVNNSIFVTLRKRNDLTYNAETMYFNYRGKKYTIATAPTNVNFDDRLITFIGVAENTKSNIEGVVPETMDITEIT